MSEDRSINLDRILVEEVGQWGPFQLRAVVLCALVIVMGALQCYAYLFVVVKVRTRCVIPECENSSTANFSPAWLLDAVPSSADSFDNCHRFKISHGSRNTSNICPVNLFDSSSVVPCEEYVYEHKNSAYYEFNLACDDFLPTLVGSVNHLGMMICLPLTGFISDRWGRRLALALTNFNLAWIGTLTYFAGSYTSYIALSFLSNVFGSCYFSCAYILALEFVGPKYRVVTGVIMSTCPAVGKTLLGLIAWMEPYWRNLILIIYLPLFVFVIYFWIAPESLRWLISKGRYEEALDILKEAALMNHSCLSETTMKDLTEGKGSVAKEKVTSEPWLVYLVLKYRPILLRCLIAPVWWITSILMYYGLTVCSIGISGNKYLNYSATIAVEIPGYWMSVLLLDRIGRKAVLVTGFWISGACQVAFIFISKRNYWLSLSVYLIGKMCVSGVTTSLYVYTAELFPTRYRSRLLSYCSMMGRIGSILAPLMPGLAAVVWVHLPFLVFGVLALLSGLLVLLAPETLGAALPDSMEEAAALGQDTPGLMQHLRTLVFRSKSYTL